jgi:D-glycero-D-manno-heptose 1,7-bisphosphate phosphatase
MTRAAVFLDKDGTLIEDIPYNIDPDRIRLAAGVAEGLPRLRSTGFRLIVISNQSGIARGYFGEEKIGPVRERLCELLEGIGVELDGFYYCPHDPEGVVPGYSIACGCRKPEPGMILEAARVHDLDLRRSWFVGDILDDVEAGRRAGCRTALIDNGHETKWKRSPLRWPDIVARDMAQAARLIESDAGSARPPDRDPHPTGGLP